MKQEDYRACMAQGLKGKKGLSKEERQKLFCVESRLCSGKASTREKAAQLCSVKSPKQAKQTEAPKTDACSTIIGMAPWVQQSSDNGVCRPCLLPPVTQWYMDVLTTAGMDNLAKDLEGAIDEGEIALAAKLDEIKDKVSPEVKARLKEFDCHAQLYKGGEDGN